MQRLRPVTLWLRALWLGLALMLPLHALASGLGWCPMSASARAVAGAEADGAGASGVDPHAHCADHAVVADRGDPTGSAADTGPSAGSPPSPGPQGPDGADTACVLCAAHASTAAWVPRAFSWGLDPASQQSCAALSVPPADAFVAGLERPPRG